MAISITVEKHGIRYDKNVDVCPVCAHAVEPKVLTSVFAGRPGVNGTSLEISFQCIRPSCLKMFVGIYRQTQINQQGNEYGNYMLTETIPKLVVPQSVPEEVTAVSERFATIYNQASEAETLGLDEVAGIGYRKALEFLIKDFCISKNPEDEDAIKTKLLGRVIHEHVEDINIKSCAERAAWLGNDETHYVRRWEDKDIEDLKILIELTLGWVRNSILTDQYMQNMDRNA